jgi:hypothetical protein
MTGEEKRRILKEQYKRDLMLRKEFLEKAQNLQKTGKVTKALTEMASAVNNDDTDDWIGRLNEGSALTEAKMDMALDEARSANQKLESLAQQAEMEKIQALNLVKQMKKDLGLPVEEEEKHLEAIEKPENTETKPVDSLPPPKTLGDF